MNRGRSDSFQSLSVRLGSVPLVLVERVGRVLFVQARHDFVPRYLGDDGRASDGKRPFVALYQRDLSHAEPRKGQRVDEQRIDSGSQGAYRLGHGSFRGRNDPV